MVPRISDPTRLALCCLTPTTGRKCSFHGTNTQTNGQISPENAQTTAASVAPHVWLPTSTRGEPSVSGTAGVGTSGADINGADAVCVASMEWCLRGFIIHTSGVAALITDEGG